MLCLWYRYRRVYIVFALYILYLPVLFKSPCVDLLNCFHVGAGLLHPTMVAEATDPGPARGPTPQVCTTKVCGESPRLVWDT